MEIGFIVKNYSKPGSLVQYASMANHQYLREKNLNENKQIME